MMPRLCSHYGNNGHYSRTCDMDGSDGCGGRGFMLFGVHVTEASTAAFRKSVSMNNLSRLDGSTPDINTTDSGYVSDDVVHTFVRGRERRRGIPWTEVEHRQFLFGLSKVGKGDWRGISRNFVKTRTPTQVASHAQKFFLRQSNKNSRRRRTSLFDITADSCMGSPTEENQSPIPMELHITGTKMLSVPAPLPVIVENSEVLSQGPVNEAGSFRPVPVPVPPSWKMADLNLNQINTPSLPLSQNVQMPSSSSSSNEEDARSLRASAFQSLTNNTGDGIIGVA